MKPITPMTLAKLERFELNRPTSAQGVALLRRALDREYALVVWGQTNRVEFRP